MKTLILHGWGGSDFPHWQSYLAGELAKDYGIVAFPLLSDKDLPLKDKWLLEVKSILKSFEPDVVVCHSLANIVWFHLCNEGELQGVKKLFLVAPPRLTCNIPELSTFSPVQVPSTLFAKSVTLITSTNDLYMDEDEAKALADAIITDENQEHIILENAGHINATSGFGEWKEIVAMVKNSI